MVGGGLFIDRNLSRTWSEKHASRRSFSAARSVILLHCAQNASFSGPTIASTAPAAAPYADVDSSNKPSGVSPCASAACSSGAFRGPPPGSSCPALTQIPVSPQLHAIRLDITYDDDRLYYPVSDRLT